MAKAVVSYQAKGRRPSTPIKLNVLVATGNLSYFQFFLKRGCKLQMVNLLHFIVVYLISVFASISLFRKRIVSILEPSLHSPNMS